ncbi:hypothetical protein OGAPHI_005040 [Ogataea philodendri]|uniref:Uncharacterized protein n=1 Tax=Ogataea philodendri TaxID=1378263 RepID=A0A9P8P217_9ASCO|nr:uncharacterized protein OGAPHI_005040 [Ogataea philodendri]KAH3663639.1 hypothetical protein OGAPHI_005040 [Ogataea philodendri]
MGGSRTRFAAGLFQSVEIVPGNICQCDENTNHIDKVELVTEDQPSKENGNKLSHNTGDGQSEEWGILKDDELRKCHTECQESREEQQNACSKDTVSFPNLGTKEIANTFDLRAHEDQRNAHGRTEIEDSQNWVLRVSISTENDLGQSPSESRHTGSQENEEASNNQGRSGELVESLGCLRSGAGKSGRRSRVCDRLVVGNSRQWNESIVVLSNTQISHSSSLDQQSHKLDLHLLGLLLNRSGLSFSCRLTLTIHHHHHRAGHNEGNEAQLHCNFFKSKHKAPEQSENQHCRGLQHGVERNGDILQ